MRDTADRATMEPSRKLAAILSSDVVGYSRLMGEDERATLETLKTYRQVMSTLIIDHGGRVVDSPGDALLADFPSAVEAVRCAVEIQRELTQRNAMLPENRRMALRIGVNLGDVIEQDAALYGDGVNIAARLQALAQPGGICVSGTVYDQVEGKLPLTFEFAGEQTVKNIAKPVRAYHVGAETGDAPHPARPRESAKSTGSRKAVLAAAVVLLVVGSVGVWTYLRDSAPPIKKEAAALQLPDKPSIAVLPFVNMSGDPEQEYFSDGMTEDVITSLSKRSGLFVIARNSVFTYKGRAVKPEQVSRELGVRYVLEGSVRKAQNHVRITAQLIDATSGFHLWAEHYDGELKDVFALQDGITRKIVAALGPKLTAGEQSLSWRPETTSIEAYDLVLRAVPVLNEMRKESNAMARQMFEKAIALDPHYARAYANLAWVHFMDWEFQWSQDPRQLNRSLAAAKKAVALDDSLSDAHCVLGWNLLWRKEHDLALAELERAVSLDPNNSDAHTFLAEALNFSGRPEEAIGFAKKAMRVDPNYPAYVMLMLPHSYWFLDRYDEALVAYREVIRRNPDFLPVHEQLAVVYAELGRENEARAEVAEILRINPGDSLELLRNTLPYKNQGDLDRNISGLRKAGLK